MTMLDDNTQTTASLLQQQIHLEETMADEAKVRQLRDNQETYKRGDWSSSKAGSWYVRSVLNAKSLDDHETFIKLISDFINVPRPGAGKHHLAAKLLKDTGIDAKVLSFIATKALINCIGINHNNKRILKSSLTIRIADHVHDEWRVKVFQDTDYRKGLMEKIIADMSKRSYPRLWRKRTIQTYFEAEKISWTGWSPRQKTVIGYALLYFFIQATGLLRICENSTYVEPTEAFVKHVDELVTKQTDLYMLYRPMLVKPRPWSYLNLFRGGYVSKHVRSYPIIKGAKRRDLERLYDSDMSKVFPALNALQDTPWRVNRQMLDALSWAYKVHGGNIGKLPNYDEEPLPPIPENYQTDDEVKKVHNGIVFRIRDRRRRSKSKRIMANVIIAMAERFAEYPAIYFPHNLDSRGRAYPVPANLNPQGPDYVKALLEFSEGETLATPEALRWVEIATANAYGNDKVSLEERSQWTKDNMEMILSIAQDYQADHRWMTVGEPFQFLRCCFEWQSIVKHGATHVTRMVIPVDATNSGLQHYSAMLKDEHGGYYVNLIPGHSRQDIYGQVAEVTIEKLMEDGSDTARHLLALGITRKATKRQVMVVPYAGKFSSCLTYTKLWVDEQLDEGVTVEWDRNDVKVHLEHTSLLSKYIWQSISETIIKGREAMLWLGKVAKEYSIAMNDSGVPVYDRRMSWTTPDGFQVAHFREDEKLQRVDTVMDGRITLTCYDVTGKLNPNDMALAVAPNFVHSLDANHLRATIIKGIEAGINSYGMIHDSFGVHATRMDQFLSEAVKPAFVEMYTQHDVLAEFAFQFASVCPVPPLPSKGELDLGGVADSEFFFS